MKCPLLHHKEHNPDMFPCEEFEDCFKEECAWWYADNHCCALLTLAQGSIYLHKAALSIAQELTLIRPRAR